MAHLQNSEKEPSSKSSNKRKSIQIYFLTLFPEVFTSYLNSSLLGKAQTKKLVLFKCIQLRDFSKDKHKRVDDTPYGGGAGMLLRVDVLYDAIKSIVKRKSNSTRTILLSPQGAKLTQEKAKKLSRYKKLVFICGHYEGVDERIIPLAVDEELSIGDYVLTGGEAAAMVVADCVTRLIPGVVKEQASIDEDSLEGGLLKHAQYTRPAEFENLGVPEVLLSGDHGKIEKWRKQNARERTLQKRPDLIKTATKEE